MADVGRDDQPRARERPRRLLRVLDRRAQVVGPLHEEHGHVRDGPGPRSGATGAAGQLSHSSSVSLASAVARSNGATRNPGWWPHPPRRGDAAPPRPAAWRAARASGPPRTSQPRTPAELSNSWRRRLGVDLDRAAPQPEHRRDVAVQRRLHRTRERGSQRRVEVAGQQHREEVHAREPVGPAPPARVDDAPRDGPAPSPDPAHEAAQVGDRILRPPAQPPAQGAEHTRHGARAVAVVRVRAVHGRHRVEHQPLYPIPGSAARRTARPWCRTTSRTARSGSRRAPARSASMSSSVSRVV